jgi:helicase
MIERFQVQPGDLYRIINTARWLMYASHEIAALFSHKKLLNFLTRLVERVEKGVKNELLPLVRLEGVGRVRARILYNANLKSVRDLKACSLEDLIRLPLIGPRLAKKIKEQVGGLVKLEDWKKLQKGKIWEQQALSDYSLNKNGAL